MRTLWVVTFLGIALISLDASAQDGPEAEARARFETARTAFSAGEYEEALREFRAAYALSSLPALLYNVGSAAERLARDDEAIEAYRGFLEALPGHPMHDEAARRVVVLEARQRARAAQPDPMGTPHEVEVTPEPVVEERGGWLFSWIGLGATALAGGAAGLSWALANDAYGSLERTCAPACNDAQIASSDVQTRIDVTTAMLITTGVLAAATVVLFVVEAPSTETPPSASLHLGPGHLALRGTF